MIMPRLKESPADIMDNFQKVSIGGAEHSGVYRPRCMRTFYNPIWADDIYGMRGAFVQTAKVRNRLYKFHEDFAISSEEGGFGLLQGFTIIQEAVDFWSRTQII